MTDSKISALAAVTDVQTTDEYVVARAGASKKITGANLKAGIGGSVELAYVEFTSGVSCTSASVSSPTTIVTAPAHTYDGSTIVLIEFWCPKVQVSSTG